MNWIRPESVIDIDNMWFTEEAAIDTDVETSTLGVPNEEQHWLEFDLGGTKKIDYFKLLADEYDTPQDESYNCLFRIDFYNADTAAWESNDLAVALPGEWLTCPVKGGDKNISKARVWWQQKLGPYQGSMRIFDIQFNDITPVASSANDGGRAALIEQWLADELAALEYNGEKVFKTADIWRHQVSALKGGIEAALRYGTFAFVSYTDCRSAREGEYDLRQILSFSILIGTCAKTPPIARVGTSSILGITKIRDLVIALFDKKHPADSLECDDLYFTDEIELLDAPLQHWVQQTFEVSFLQEYS